MTRALPLTEPPADLTALRAELDAVDDGLHAKIVDRLAVVEAIAAAKAPSGVVIRPDREAAVLSARLAAGGAPAFVIVAVWRTLITAACLAQRPFRVHAAAPLEVAALLYPNGALVRHTAAVAAVAAVAQAPGDVALVEAGTDALRAHGPVHPFLKVPLDDGRTLLVVGGADVERSAGPIPFVARDNVLVEGEAGSAELALARANAFPLTLSPAQVP